MNAPFKPAPVLSQGWNDPTLAHAYRLLNKLYDGLPDDGEGDFASAVFAAMESIEAADCECGR